MITTPIKLSYGSQTVPPVIPVVQGDTGRNLAFTITDYNIPAGATATYFVSKPSGESVYNSATISGNVVTAQLTAQSIIEPGNNYGQLRILLENEVITSFDFVLLVRPFRGIGAVESSSEANIFDKAVEQAAEQFQEDAEQIVEEVKQSIPADYTALTEEVGEINERLGDKAEQTEVDDLKNTLPFSDVTDESEMTDTSLMYRMGGYIYYYDNVSNAWKRVGSGGSGTGSNVLPKMYLNGDISTMTQSVAVTLQYTYVDENNKDQRTGWLKCKWQGESSLNYPKKNFNFTFYHDASASRKDKIEFMEDCKESKWTAKANWIDHSAARNIFSAKLWKDIVKSRHTAVPALLADSPRYGAIDGYPFMCYINGSFQGLYTMNIKKDDFTFGMDEDNPLHCAICGDLNNNGDTTKNLSPEFRLASTTGWEVEVPSRFTTDTSAGLIALINFVMSSTDADFKENLNTYLDVESAIDYYIFVYFIGAFDNLARNMILLTYDGGAKWYCSAYDLDSTFGLKAFGQLTFPSNGRFQEDYAETNSLLWQRLEANFGDEIYARYQELRSSVLNVSYMYRELEWFMNSIPEDDYLADVEKWPTMPNPRVDHLEQIETFISERAVYVDRKIAGGASVTNIDSVDLSDSTMSFVEKVEVGLNQTYFTEQETGLQPYKKIDNTTCETITSSGVNDYASVDEIPIELNSAVVVNPSKTRLFDWIYLITENGTKAYGGSVWYNSNAWRPQGINTVDNWLNTSFMFPLAKGKVFDVAGAKLQVNNSLSTAQNVDNMSVGVLKGWTTVAEADIPSGTGDWRTSALVPVNEGDIVFIRQVNGEGDTSDYYSAVLQFETQATASDSASAINDTKAPMNWATVQSGYTYVGFKVNRNMYNNGGHLEYIVISGGESSIIVENSHGWDDQTVVAEITPANATIDTVVWTSSNTSIVTVTPSATNQYEATVKAVAKGTATITCTVTDTDGISKSSSATITVA